ncbi:hypothetical protein ACO2Q3_21240 [Caulobacter sp. KR2-114]|uniref:hypothetical protein n=1 Tax=Caulobacter sp. KR2-114 TaxID=3400912 RepID=UPI003C04B3DF
MRAAGMDSGGGRGRGALAVTLCLVALALAPASALAQGGTFAQAAVAGVTLGAPAGEAVAALGKLSDARGAGLRRGAAQMGAYATPEVLFGAAAQADGVSFRLIFGGGPSPSGTGPAGVPWVSNATAARVIGLHKADVFDPDDAQTFTVVLQALTDRFGPPDLLVRDARRNPRALYWSSSPVITLARPEGLDRLGPAGSLAQACRSALGLGARGSSVGADYYAGQVVAAADPRLAQCGTWLEIDLTPEAPDSRFVRRIEYKAADLTQLARAYDTLRTLVLDGAAWSARRAHRPGG